MKVILFAKLNKPTVKEVINHLKKCFDVVTVYGGERGDPFPITTLVEPPDILISYISPWIIPKEILDKTKLWNINFHPGPPEYPGIGCFNFAIYNCEETYGVTAHLMEQKVDRGKIIGVKRFPLLESDSVFTLSIKTYEYMLSLFFEIINYIALNKSIHETNEKWKRKPYIRKELKELCKIDFNMSQNEVKKRIKSTSYPNMPGPYIELFGYRFEYNSGR